MRKTRRTLLKSVGAGAIGSLAMSSGLMAASTSKLAQDHKPRAAKGPTAVRCVVTGQTKSGKSLIVSQAPVPAVTVALMPGYEFYPLWGNDEQPVLPSDGTPTAQPPWFPPNHGFRFAMFTVPPITTVRTGPAPSAAELEEVRQKLPGMLEVLEVDHPGMHTTDSVDFDVVLSGEVVLELDDGVETLLRPGDCVVQNGTRHAWHNRSTEKCVLVSCLIGAERKPATSP
jgi:mannose-6-phosphate isomerase-like protein (cupin superfamily)